MHTPRPRTTRRVAALPLLVAAALAAAALPAGAAATPAAAAPAAAPPASGSGTDHAVDDPFTSERTSWFRQDRFGMFIHFGAYSNLEGEYTRPDGTVCRDAEWIKRQCNIPDEEYEKQAATFNPADFDAEAVVGAAKDAGMRYIVITSKHHDGYAMWPTKVNSWNLRDHSAFDKRRDIMAELKKAAKKAGIKLGFYYSIWDWHDPDFADPATFPQYEKRMYAQLKELVDNYDPALLWFDGEWATDRPHNPWTAQDGERLETYLRGLDPDLVVNNRVGKRRVTDGDYGTPEQEIPGAPVDGQLWESCMTLNGHWGYARYDENWKSSASLVRNLLSTASRSGNYLLNVGPDARGRVPEPSVQRLGEMGDWLRTAGQGNAVYGAGFGGLVEQPDWGFVSRKGDKLYAAVTTWPAAGGSLHLKARTDIEVTGARVLGSDQQVTVTEAGDGYDLTPAGSATNDAATVIELTADPGPTAAPGGGTGLKQEVYDNPALTGTPKVTRTDADINHSWKYTGSPAKNIPADGFSVRWTGSVEPRRSETYTLTTVSDDNVRVWLDGKLVIDNWTPHNTSVDKAQVDLEAGTRHSLKVEYAEQTGDAHMKLLWSSPGQDQQIIPQQQLYPN
ncbi:alpha-L-fucosidase [Streptomyces sp. CMB-StM0423]|uniref:alpha-L-fucosidase n=1 Tax=Streptomyces sp. CMB-StM0423 TaxID=2059884 RepID=UPI000C702856|nr:alpha-L-fucosidase [Streptomyces sp. CMB-StM0423]AUH39508.1 alpha-L-fucosidase [Streptomyces sp. CMB-StM0423]